MAIPIGIVEDNPRLQKRLEQNLSQFPDVNILFIAGSGEEALDVLSSATRMPEVMLMDIELPGISGIETTAKIKTDWPEIETVMITVFEDENKIIESIKAGAVGYLLKDETPDYIVQSIHEVLQGGAPMTRSIARKILGSVSEKLKPPVDLGLSEREVSIIKLIVDARTYTEIAEVLFISPHTVKTHIKNIYKKLHVHSKASLVKLAMNKKIV